MDGVGEGWSGSWDWDDESCGAGGVEDSHYWGPRRKCCCRRCWGGGGWFTDLRGSTRDLVMENWLSS